MDKGLVEEVEQTQCYLSGVAEQHGAHLQGIVGAQAVITETR